MDLVEAGPWVPSEVVGVGAVVAAVFVEAVAAAVAAVAAVVVVAAAAAAAVVVAVVAVAAPQGSESDVGAYGPAGTDHFWVMHGANNPVIQVNRCDNNMVGETVAYLLRRRGAIPFYTMCHVHLLHLLCHGPTILQLSMRVGSRRARNATILWIRPELRRML